MSNITSAYVLVCYSIFFVEIEQSVLDFISENSSSFGQTSTRRLSSTICHVHILSSLITLFYLFVLLVSFYRFCSMIFVGLSHAFIEEKSSIHFRNTIFFVRAKNDFPHNSHTATRYAPCNLLYNCYTRADKYCAHYIICLLSTLMQNLFQCSIQSNT